jgi:hypothetical protein
MTYQCKHCKEEKDEKEFPHENGKIRRYTCWSCRSKRETAQNKVRLLAEFGWKCQCCGEAMPQFLTLDHIKGKASMGEAPDLPRMYSWLNAVKKGFPKDEYQLLCMNCNFAKGHYGVCPHQTGTTIQAEVEKLITTASTVFTSRHATESQLRALDAGRHLGPIARWGEKEDNAGQLLGLTEEQFSQLKEILKSEKNSS